MRLLDEENNPLDAEFELEETPQGVDVVLQSKSGPSMSGQGRNTEYNAVLELLLQRFASAGVTIRRVEVDSTVARRLPLGERLIALPYPLTLSPATDAGALRIQITEGQRTVASDVPEGRPGGNKHKRIRLSVDLTGTGVVSDDLPELLNAHVELPVDLELGRTYQQAKPNSSVKPADLFTFDPSVRERALGAHAAVQNGLAALIKQQGFDPRSPTKGEPDFDLAWIIDGDVVVAEVKSLSGTDQTQQLRLGLGQILHYRHQLSELHGTVLAVLAIEFEPGSHWVELCRDVGVLLTWPPDWTGLSAITRFGA
jgi:hypothetical protein